MAKAFPEAARSPASADPKPEATAPPAESAAEARPATAVAGAPRPVAKADGASPPQVALGEPIPVTEASATVDRPKTDPEVRKAQADAGDADVPPIVMPPDDPTAPGMGGRVEDNPPPFLAPGDVDDLNPLPDAAPNASGAARRGP